MAKGGRRRASGGSSAGHSDGLELRRSDFLEVCALKALRARNLDGASCHRRTGRRCATRIQKPTFSGRHLSACVFLVRSMLNSFRHGVSFHRFVRTFVQPSWRVETKLATALLGLRGHEQRVS